MKAVVHLTINSHVYLVFIIPAYSIETVTLYLSLSERDIFSVGNARVSKKEEQHCFCKQLNISGIPRDSETVGQKLRS